MKHRLHLIVFVFFSFCLAPVSVYGADEPPAITALFDVMERQYKEAGGGRPEYGSIEPDGSGGATLNNVRWTMKQKDIAGTFEITKVIISGVTQRSSGAYSFETITSENIKMELDLPDIGPLVVTIPKTSARNTHLLPTASGDGIDYSALLGGAVYENSTVPLMTVSIAGKSFDAKNFTSNWSGNPETGLGKWDMSLQSVVIPVSAFPDPQFKKDIKEEFGFEHFDLAFDGSVEVSEKNKNLDLAYGLRFKGKNIGDFEFALAARNIPAKLATTLKELQTSKKPNMGQLMPMIVGIKFAKLKLRFVDDNFTAKMLAFVAKKEGTTVEELTANGAALLQIGLSQLNVPEFTKSVVGAYKAFVKDPQNISIEASPAEAVALATLMGMIAAPAAAVKALGLKVEANK